MNSVTRRSPYLVGPLYDWALFLLPPTVALWLGFMIAGSDFSNSVFTFAGSETTAAEIGLGALIHAHLVAVVFRSHGNRDIFRQFPYRFLLVPILVWLAIVSSMWMAITATVVATFWDVWHSGAQTFGFARIYDRNVGAPLEQTRRLEKWVNQLLYAGPILAGVTLADHVQVFYDYENVDFGAAFFTAIPARADSYQRDLAFALLIVGGFVIGHYIAAHVRLYRQGHPIAPLKIFLVASTGLCSILAWGFNSWGEAFFIMNLFHAIQYLGLVWAMENKRMMQLFGLARFRAGRQMTLALFLGSIGLYGVGAQLVTTDLISLWAITIVVSLMHFWYDGFVWSVRKKQV